MDITALTSRYLIAIFNTFLVNLDSLRIIMSSQRIHINMVSFCGPCYPSIRRDYVGWVSVKDENNISLEYIRNTSNYSTRKKNMILQFRFVSLWVLNPLRLRQSVIWWMKTIKRITSRLINCHFQKALSMIFLCHC